MTTIVTSFSKQKMAADSNFDWGGSVYKSEKIFRMPCGALWGVCGSDVDSAFRFIEWVQQGSDPGKKPRFKSTNDFSILELSMQGLALYGWTMIRQPIQEDFYAVGSGAYAAQTAWLMRASLKRCVEMAIKVDKDTKGPVLVERL